MVRVEMAYKGGMTREGRRMKGCEGQWLRAESAHKTRSGVESMGQVCQW
jgi:hypothetical protein